MFRSNSPSHLRAPQRATPTAQALAVSAAFLAALLLAGTELSLPWLPALAFGAVVTVVLHGLGRYPHGALGLCNTVTLFRAALVALLFGALFDPTFSAWLVFALASVAFALDGADGWLARRARLTSRFGARFDMETDALLSAVLAVWLVANGIAGPEALILGFARYAFVGAALALPALGRDLPESFRRKAVCVVQIGTLIVLLLPVTSASVAAPLAWGAVLLLLWSFAVDIRWLLRRRG
ncbi:MAG: CDP-alcohol phosphatidyltransferase family protein [Pseudomonadota bacterium]